MVRSLKCQEAFHFDYSTRFPALGRAAAKTHEYLCEMSLTNDRFTLLKNVPKLTVGRMD